MQQNPSKLGNQGFDSIRKCPVFAIMKKQKGQKGQGGGGQFLYQVHPTFGHKCASQAKGGGCCFPLPHYAPKPCVGFQKRPGVGSLGGESTKREGPKNPRVISGARQPLLVVCHGGKRKPTRKAPGTYV